MPTTVPINFTAEEQSTIEGRLLDGVQRHPSGCWIWVKSRTPEGYGKIKFRGQFYRPHRLSYSLFRSPIPDGMFICHHCDNPPCCNPYHLFLGTGKDNIQDCISKGRLRHVIPIPENRLRGERSHLSKLTAVQVESIRKEYKPGVVTQAMLAKRYSVSADTIHNVIHGKTWASVGGSRKADHRKKENGSISIPPRVARWSDRRRRKYDANTGLVFRMPEGGA